MKDNKQKRIFHMIGNAHIDPVWLWRFQDGVETVRSTFRSALDRMKEDKKFIFTSASAVHYKWIEEIDPDMFNEIKKRVKEGRWCIAGGWWIQPDCNIPSGESFVRQGLYGQRYFLDKFRKIAKVGYNVDSFGHNGMLPQILKKSGIDAYVFMRPFFNEKKLPGIVFWWKSPDGSKVLTYRIPHSYCDSSSIEEKINNLKNEKIEEAMVFYGVGNHGGGPTKKSIAEINEMVENKESEIIKFSSPNLYFNSMLKKNKKFPVVMDDLQHHTSGCYSVHSEVKKLNRIAELELMAAEKFSTLAMLLFKRRYPQDEITRSWQNVLFCQFHDILAGSSIIEAYDDVRNMYGEAIFKADEIINYSIQAISSKIDTRGDGLSIIVFNPHSWEIRYPVEYEQWKSEYDYLKDDEGKDIPLQRIGSSATIGDLMKRFVFIADVPAFGYRVYSLIKNGSKKKLSSLISGNTKIENEFLRLEISDRTGYVKSLYDKINKVEIFKKDSSVPVVIKDESDTWSHGITNFHDEIGKFKKINIKVIEDGDTRAKIRVKSYFGDSIMYQDYILYRELSYVEVRVFLDWHERHKMLKISFPVNVKEPKATYSIPYGYINRPTDGEEEPMQQWVDLTGKIKSFGKEIMYGVSILNDSKYSADIKDSEIRLTVLRSPVYAHDKSAKLSKNQDYKYIDQGEQEFSYLIFPHKGTWQNAGIVKIADSFNMKPITILESSHNGILPKRHSFISIDRKNIIVSVIKKSEDNKDIILRFYETSGYSTKARIKFMDSSFTVSFKPCEIKTFRIVSDGNIKAERILEF